MEQISITLVRAQEDAPERDPQSQVELETFSKALRALDVTVSQSVTTAGTARYPIGQFLVSVASTMLSAVAGVVVAWLRACSGRRVRIAVGDAHQEARTSEDVEKLLAAAAEFGREARQKRGRL